MQWKEKDLLENLVFKYKLNTMNKIFITQLLLLLFTNVFTQNNVNTVQPKIMVIPYVKEGQDIRTILEADFNKRTAVSEVKKAFDSRGFTTVDFVSKLKAAKDNQIMTSDNQTDLKTQIVEMSGCDIYVEVEIEPNISSSGNSVNLILQAFEASTGNSLSNENCRSNKFYTNDFAVLSSKAVESCIEPFLNTMQIKFTDIVNNGKSVIVDFSFAQGSPYSMSSEMGADGLPFSDILEEWVANNSVKNNYHIQGTTDKKMIFDDIHIPLKDANGKNYNSTKYALDIFKFLKSLGLNPSKIIKSNTIYITIK